MTALLRADWLRLRRRKDLWIIAIAVCVIGLVSFVNTYHTDASDPTGFTTDPALIRQDILSFAGESGFFEGMTEAEQNAQIDQMVADQLASNQQQLVDYEAQQRITLQRYAFPQSIFTILGSGIIALVALVLIASLAIGDEFRFGTIRTSLLAAGDRRRFLLARLISILTLTVGLWLVLILAGSILGLGLGLIGADLGDPPAAVDAASALVWLGGQLLTTMVVIALATALTLLLRSGALPVLLIVIGGFVELFVAHLPVFAPGEFLSGVPQAFLVQNIRLLSAVLGQNTHALALAEVGELPYQAFALPMVGVAAIVAAWGALFLLLADRRLRTMDVVE
jgi:ABC-type transport system involved in multi-copper enzyme maturation permease subunit